MKEKIFIILFSLLICGCQIYNVGVNNGQEPDISTQEASQRKNPLFVSKNGLNSKNFPLSTVGRGRIEKFFAKINLAGIENLSQVSGNRRLDKQTCKLIFKVYNEKNPKSNISGEQCNWNLNEDNTYVDTDPLSVSVSEIDERYILLLIDEVGLGAPKLFTYLYDVRKEEITTFERPPLGETTPYYHSNIIYFVNVSGYLEFAYDLSKMRPVSIEIAPNK